MLSDTVDFREDQALVKIVLPFTTVVQLINGAPDGHIKITKVVFAGFLKNTVEDPAASAASKETARFLLKAASKGTSSFII